jgi:hypothetical protein
MVFMKAKFTLGALGFLVLAFMQWTTPARASDGCIKFCEQQQQKCRSYAQSFKGDDEKAAMKTCQLQWQYCLRIAGVYDWKAYVKACYGYVVHRP